MVGPLKDGAQTDAAHIEQLVGTLRSDPALSVFLEDQFSPTKHVGTAVRQHRIQAALDEAQRASSLLSSNVRHEVIRRKDALLAEVEAVDALEKEVHTVSTGVSSLVTATEALSDALEQPYQPMRASMRRLTNLTAAADLIRAVIRFRYCIGKLADAGLYPAIGPSSTTNATNLPPAASAIRELERLISSASHGLDKVDGVAKDIIAVRKAGPEVRKRAIALLKVGLSNRNQPDIEAAVVAFNSLGVLPERVNGEVARLLRETQSVVHRGLEAPPGAVKASNPSAITSATNELWTNIDRMLNTVVESCIKVVLLQQVLSRRYCDITHKSLLHDLIASNFIDSVSRTICEQVSILSRTRLQRPSASFVFLALAEGYPRLRQSLTNMADRVTALARVSPSPITSLESTAKLPLIPDQDFIQRAFMNTVLDVETHYLTASLERLSKTVSFLFEGGKQPGEAEALSLTKTLVSELNAARADKQLFRIAVSNVAQAIRLYTSQAEDYAAATAPDEEVTGKPISVLEEWRLTSLYNGMVSLSTSASRSLGEREDGSGAIPVPIEKELKQLSRMSDLLLEGLFSTCKNNIRKVLERMHTEDLEGVVGDDGCSVYVLDITAQISMFAEGIIPGLGRSRSLGNQTLGLAKWALDSFSRHVGLVFPQSESAKIRLSTDTARLELAVESLCSARLLGSSYKALRALRSSILLDTEEFMNADDAVVRQIRDLPCSTLAHVLLGRSNEDTLKQPHRRRGMKAGEYVEWMNHNTEEALWNDVKISLNEYKRVAPPEEDSLCPEYRAVTSICEKLAAMR
ncbi:Golgi transport complex subunit 5 [Gracilaria domingensis]|nr:Golgi transport complex subunit 5 [Gracilaria domingensis]